MRKLRESNTNSESLTRRWLQAFALGLVLMMGATAPASAVSLFAAYWDTSDLGKAGGLGLGFQFGGKLAFEIAGTYYEELDDHPGGLIEDGPFIADGFQVTPIDAGFVWRAGSGRQNGFFLGGGATLFLIDTSASGISTDDEAGWYGKAGYEFGSGGGTTFYIEAIYRQVDTEVGLDLGIIDDVPSGLDLDLNGVAFHAGVRF